MEEGERGPVRPRLRAPRPGVPATSVEDASPALPLPLRLRTPRPGVPTTSVEDASPVLPLPPRGGSTAHRAADGRGGKIGRYVVIKELGAGGMGLVLAAYDPDLERKVALKILREDIRDGSAGAMRMRREAQAMARLSHPNVAQVYEVAEAEGRLFLAMEFIAGATLREWLTTPRRWEEVLRVYGEAGQGLAAAHAAGLMHRDFKPENAMLAADGRVRVLDFGLSRLYAAGEEPEGASRSGAVSLQVTAAGTLLGTPAYMSPEQHDRGEVDARSDQFSFCVALWEALYGQRPFAGETMLALARSVRTGEVVAPPAKSRVPAWVRRVLERGLAAERDRRWPTMQALLTALASDPQRARRRWLVAGAAVLAIGAAGYGAAALRAAESRMCGGAAEEMIGVWDADRRAAVERAVLATGVSYAERTLAATRGHLDVYAGRWQQIYAGSCEAHRRGHLSPQLFDRRMACLRQRRSELMATAAVLEQTTRESIAQASEAARGLPAVTSCEDDARLLAAVAPPEDPQVAARVEAGRGRLARLQALERAGRNAEAFAEMPPLIAEADALGYVPLRAEVHLLYGKLSMHLGDLAGRGRLEHALWLALESQVDAVAAEAAILRIFHVGWIERQPREALALEPMAWALVRRIGSPPPLVALLYNNAATAWDELGEVQRAIETYEEGLALVARRVPDDPTRWALANNLALSLSKVGEHTRMRALMQETLPQVVAVYDACHLAAASVRGTLATAEAGVGEFDAALVDYEAELACIAADYPVQAMHEVAAVARVYMARGDEAEARRQLERAAALERRAGGEHPWGLDLLRADIAVAYDPPAAARAVVTALRGGPGASEQVRARLGTRLALLAHRAGDDEEALALLGQTGEELLRAEQAERGLYAFTHARVLRALGREPERAAARAEEALVAYTTAGALYTGQVAEIRAWQAAR